MNGANVAAHKSAPRSRWVGIAHSVDQMQGKGGTDLPGPHLATYGYGDAGARLAQQDEQMSTFTTFHRPVLAEVGLTESTVSFRVLLACAIFILASLIGNRRGRSG